MNKNRGICLKLYILTKKFKLFSGHRNKLLKIIRSCMKYGLKGLSHEIFRPVFWPVWMHLGLNVNRLWFFNFKEGSLILYIYFKY